MDYGFWASKPCDCDTLELRLLRAAGTTRRVVKR